MLGTDPTIPVTRIELPTYYLIFVVLAIGLVVWGVIKIFGHDEKSHDHEH